MQLAIRHRPQLDEIRDPYVELLRRRYGEDVRFYYWPERRGLRETKMDLSWWFEKGFPFTLMLYSNAGSQRGGMVLVLTVRVNEATYCDRAGLPANFRTGCTLQSR